MITIQVFKIEVIDQYSAQHYISGTSFSFLEDLTCIIFFGDSPEAVFKDPIMVKKHPCPDTIEVNG